jgi:hypothetical protein
VTDVAPVKLAPAIVTLVPTLPLVGSKLVTTGAEVEVTVKSDELVAVPCGVVTAIRPVVAPRGTVAVTCVSESRVNVALTPAKVTDVAPVKPLPAMTTLVPTAPTVGSKLVIVGALVTTKSDELVPVPSGVVTEIGPVVAPLGTIAVIWLAELTVKLAATPAKLTDVAPVKLAPAIVTLVPALPLVGLKLVMVGAGRAAGRTSTHCAIDGTPEEERMKSMYGPGGA